MIFKHYRELVRPADAKTWFALEPGGEEKMTRKPEVGGQKAEKGQEPGAGSQESGEPSKAA